MADLDWPEGVPTPLLSGRTRTDVTGWRESDVVAGPAVTEVLSYDMPTFLGFSVKCTKGEARLFRLWLRDNRLQFRPQYFNLPILLEDPNVPTQEAKFLLDGFPRAGAPSTNGTIVYQCQVLIRKIESLDDDYSDEIRAVGEVTCYSDIDMGASLLDEAITNMTDIG